MAVLTAADRRFDDLLHQRFGTDYLGWTGAAYAPAIGGGFVSRPRGAKLETYVLHHTAGRQADTGADIWRFHTRRLGWSTDGYHVFVRNDGRVELLIPPSWMSYGAGPQWNPTTVHVVTPGNYANVHDPATAPLDAIYRVFCALDDAYGGRPWRPHSALKPTACPGRLQAHLAVMRGARYGAADPRPAHYP